MGRSVNFDHLREITDGDAAMEAELFSLFLTCSADCLAGLKNALESGDENMWRDQAHAFKGVAFNLGANPLGEMCKKAQDDYRASPDEKKALLEGMERELECVKQELKECK